VPNPDEDLEPPAEPERHPSHFRKKRPDNTTKLIRVAAPSTRPEPDVSHVVKSPGLRQEQWSEVVNPTPALPDPVVKRPLPPPAPLPSEASRGELEIPGWTDERARRKRREDIIGTVGLALMVAAMLAAIWLRMTSGNG
jgi:hypothetical protein